MSAAVAHTTRSSAASSAALFSAITAYAFDFLVTTQPPTHINGRLVFPHTSPHLFVRRVRSEEGPAKRPQLLQLRHASGERNGPEISHPGGESLGTYFFVQVIAHLI